MNKSKSTFPIIIILILISIIITFFILKTKSSSSSTTQSLPNFKIEVINYPKQINCYTEPLTVQFKLTNKSQTNISFQDFTNQKYDLGICDGDKSNNSVSCFTLQSHSLFSLNNFGTIKPNETKTLTLTTPTTNSQSNVFANFAKTKINGEYRFFIQLSSIQSDTKKPEIGRSQLFTLTTNIMNPTNEYIKDCQ